MTDTLFQQPASLGLSGAAASPLFIYFFYPLPGKAEPFRTVLRRSR